MRTLVFSTAALTDLAEIEMRIEKLGGSAAVAQRFVETIIAKCKRLAILDARVGRRRPELLPDIRSFPFRDYLIFFLYVDDTFYVVNILHSARDINSFFEREDEDLQ